MKTFILTSLLLTSSLLLAACVAPSGTDPVGVDRELVVVTADDTNALGPDARLSEPFSEGFAYRFDASKGAIDFGRIDLVDEQGSKLAMDMVVSRMADEQGVDASSFQQRTFAIGTSPADFEVPSDDSAESAPEATPQAKMSCYYRYCIGYYCWFYDADCP